MASRIKTKKSKDIAAFFDFLHILFVGRSLQENEYMTTNTYKPGQITALYARLSHKDTLEGDDNSIVNQKAVLSEYVAEKVDRKRVQKVDIVFNFVEEINFLSATQPKRQGV